MRLINANALMAEMHNVIIEDGEDRRIFYEVIERQPTIEERKRGKWIVTSEFEDCRYAKCNQCKVTQIFCYGKPLTNFCPNCGADMRKREGDNV